MTGSRADSMTSPDSRTISPVSPLTSFSFLRFSGMKATASGGPASCRGFAFRASIRVRGLCRRLPRERYARPAGQDLGIHRTGGGMSAASFDASGVSGTSRTPGRRRTGTRTSPAASRSACRRASSSTTNTVWSSGTETPRRRGRCASPPPSSTSSRRGRGLKKAQTKAATRWTETGYEAYPSDERADDREVHSHQGPGW